MEQKERTDKGTPASNNNLFVMVQPELNTIFFCGPLVMRVVYVNAGKQRISGEFIGTLVRRPAKEGAAPETCVGLANGTVVDMIRFQEYCRERWPKKHEQGRNPANVTLGVKGGSFTSSAKFTKK